MVGKARGRRNQGKPHHQKTTGEDAHGLQDHTVDEHSISPPILQPQHHQGGLHLLGSACAHPEAVRYQEDVGKDATPGWRFELF